MLLKIEGNELEILRGKFVCFSVNNGETSYFSEWRELDWELQDKFEAIREQLLEVMENFMNSKHSATFEAISEEYENNMHHCSAKMPESEVARS